MPIVFLAGFWTHRAVAPAQRAIAIRGKGPAPSRKPAAQDVVSRDWKGNAAPLFYSAPPAGDPTPPQMNFSLFNFGQARPGEQSPGFAPRGHDATRVTIPANPPTFAAHPPAEIEPTRIQPAEKQPAGTRPVGPVVQTAAAAAASGPADGFALRSSAAGQFVADVQVPGNSWFSLAGATADCESGTCQLVPMQTADRKLNTLLEWTSTPQLAAEQASREGKLVFLIHVSGNFAQPGFT